MQTVITEEMESAAFTADIKKENKQSPFADYIKEVIYGGIDGIVTTFAVVAGFSGAALSNEVTTQLSFLIVLLFGLANLFADAASMGLGNFLSVRSEQDLYNSVRDKETAEVRANPDKEYKETVALMIQKGFSSEDSQVLASIYKTNEDYWIDFMMNNEYEMSDPRDTNPVYTGLATFASFLVFGTVPLLPFIFLTDASARLAFELSILGTFTALVMLGLLKWKVIGNGIVKSLVEVVVVGSVAALLAFIVGTFFNV